MMNDVYTYCNTWGLKMNTLKTKAIVFERGRHTHYQFYVGNTPIETVTSFKYLGMTLYKNGNWARTLKYIASHASYSLFNLFKVLNHAEFSFEKK